MRRGSWRTLLVTLGVLAACPPAAALELSDVHGHMTLGFSHLFASDTTNTPGGSISFGASVDIPLTERLRTGVGFGYHLLGSQTLVQGSLSSGIDYSVLEGTALLYWSPLDHGPDVILSAGPGFFHAKAQLASTSVGLAFTPHAVDDFQLGAAFGVSVLRRKATPVRPGFDLGVRIIPLGDVTWTVASIGIGLRY